MLLAKRLADERLADARHVLEKHVLARQQGRDAQADDTRLAKHDFGDIGFQLTDQAVQLGRHIGNPRWGCSVQRLTGSEPLASFWDMRTRPRQVQADTPANTFMLAAGKRAGPPPATVPGDLAKDVVVLRDSTNRNRDIARIIPQSEQLGSLRACPLPPPPLAHFPPGKRQDHCQHGGEYE